MKLKRTGILVALALFGGVLTVGIGQGADWSVVPSVNLKGEYDSNLNWAISGPRQRDFIFTLQPGADFNYTTDIGMLQGRLGWSGLVYADHAHADHIDQNYQINGSYQAAPRLSLTLNSAYIVDSSLQQEFITSGVIMTRTPRQSILLGPGLTYALTERLSASMGYSFSRVNYTDPQFRDYSTQLVNLRFNYLMKNEKTTLSSVISGTLTQYPGNDLYRSLGTYLGVSHKFSPKWEASLLAGANFSFQSFATQVQDFSSYPFFILVKTQRQTQTGVSPYIDLSLTRRWTQLALTGGYSRNQSPSAYGGIFDYNGVYLTCSYDFSEKLTGSLRFDYSLSTAASQLSNYENAIYTFTPQVTYRLTEKLSMVPGYSFGRRDDLISGQSGIRHNVWLMLTYTYPLHYQR